METFIYLLPKVIFRFCVELFVSFVNWVEREYTVAGRAILNNRFASLRFPNALRCSFTAASGIKK
ncbi:MAG: hypothetical protein LBJ00_05575 [Planctomycetaceae bacterium]|nr:hypothetical protein [Planctomycetaceae bacterium]